VKPVRIVSVAYRLRRRGRAGCSATAKADTRVAIRVKGVPLLGEADRCRPIGQIHRCCSGSGLGDGRRLMAPVGSFSSTITECCRIIMPAVRCRLMAIAGSAIVAREPIDRTPSSRFSLSSPGRQRLAGAGHGHAAFVRQCWTATARAGSDLICRVRANVATPGIRLRRMLRRPDLVASRCPGSGGLAALTSSSDFGCRQLIWPHRGQADFGPTSDSRRRRLLDCKL
jgi:hypothetical protein